MRTRASGRLVMAALCCSAVMPGVGAAGRDLPRQAPWLAVTTANFEMTGPSAEADLRRVGEQLERFRDALGQVLPRTTLAAARRPRVIVFPTDAEYAPFKPLYGSKPREHVVGHAVMGPTSDYLVLTLEGDADRGTIYHEYVHSLVHNSIVGVPVWFDEGLAEYFSSFVATADGRAQIGNVLRPHMLLLRAGPLLPLATLAAVDHESPLYNETAKATMFYAQSWALVHYLLLGGDQPDATRLAALVGRLTDGVPFDRACLETLQIPPEALADRLASYIRQDTFVHQLLTLKPSDAGVIRAPAVQVAEADVHSTLADVLLLMQRPAESELQLEAALARDPEYAPAHATFGQLLAAAGRPAEARAHLARAIASPTATWLTHYTYAALLIGERQPLAPGGAAPGDAIIERSLRRAIALNSGPAEPHGQLGWLLAQSTRTLGEAEALIDEALARAPAHEAFNLVRAAILIQTRREDVARPLLARLVRASNVDVRRQAVDLVSKLATFDTTVRGRTAEDVGLAIERGAAPAAGVFVFRPLGAGEQRVAAWLSAVDCGPRGVVFAGRTAAGTFRMQAPRFEAVQLLAYANRRVVRCGERFTDAVVLVTYTNGRTIGGVLEGQLVSLEFPPPGYTPVVRRH